MTPGKVCRCSELQRIVSKTFFRKIHKKNLQKFYLCFIEEKNVKNKTTFKS